MEKIYLKVTFELTAVMLTYMFMKAELLAHLNSILRAHKEQRVKLVQLVQRALEELEVHKAR